MAFALPVWLAVHEEFFGTGGTDGAGTSCFDDFDDDALFELFHITGPCLAFIRDSVLTRMKKVCLKKTALPADQMLMVALNYYAHGVPSADILQRVGLNQTNCPAVISTVSRVIAGMSDQFISFPQVQEAKDIVSSKIQTFCGIPNALGVLAPVHVKIRASPYEKESFRSFVNALGYTSVLSQIICDFDGNILNVDKCCVGSAFEQDMWESSSKGKEIEEGVHGAYWVIGGKGYLPSKHVLTPVSKPANDNETRFNEAHKKILNAMQTTLGCFKRRFRCLMQLGFAQEGSLDKKSNIIIACSVLHNISKKFSVPAPPVAGKIEDLHPGRQRSLPAEIDPEVLKARQELIDENFSVVSGSKEPPSKDTTKDDV